MHTVRYENNWTNIDRSCLHEGLQITIQKSKIRITINYFCILKYSVPTASHILNHPSSATRSKLQQNISSTYLKHKL